MKKTGILTFHKSINYGSALQAWALQTILTKADYQAEIIDYEPAAYKRLYRSLKPVRSVYDLKYDLQQLPYYRCLENQNRQFSRFRSEKMRLSAASFNQNSDFSALSEEYGAIVCGSDQIWNVKAYDCDDIYFLPQKLESRKIAYAVSVNNMDFTEPRCDEKLKSSILDFYAISSREASGAEKIQKFINHEKQVDAVLDPTLLLSREEYEKLCSPRIYSEDYIFLYNVWAGGDVIDAALALAEKLHLPVRAGLMTQNAWQIRKLQKRGIQVELKHTAPEDFLSLIHHAKYVVTDSFHGTVFSVVFGKQFFSINSCDKQGKKKNDERILGLLTQLNLECRYILKEDIVSGAERPIDGFEEIDRKRKMLGEASEKWLLKALEGTK